MARKSQKCKSCSCRVSANARRMNWVMDLLLDIFFLGAWGPVLRGRTNEDLGQTSSEKNQSLSPRPSPCYTHPSFFFQEPFFQLCGCSSGCFILSVLGGTGPLPAGYYGASPALQQWSHGHGGAGPDLFYNFVRGTSSCRSRDSQHQNYRSQTQKFWDFTAFLISPCGCH